MLSLFPFIILVKHKNGYREKKKIIQKPLEVGNYFMMSGLSNMELSKTMIRLCAAFVKRLLLPTLTILIVIL